jgi:hypothetical protein
MSSPDSNSQSEPLEYVVEFGEPVYLRPGGCPDCGETVTVHVGSCEACGGSFEPWER